jgi:hypothetical protein
MVRETFDARGATAWEPDGVERAPSGAPPFPTIRLSIRLPASPSYPQDLRFDGHRVAEDKACELHDRAGRRADL